MKWSWKIAQVAGIAVRIHATFWLIVIFVGASHWLQGQGVAGTIEGVAFVLALFLCVVLHEFGHALTARRFGIKTRDITLLPIGGVARLERMPDKPLQELWVALAGPAVNVVIALLLFAWLIVAALLRPLSELSVTGGPFLERLMVVNIFLVLFNLLPAFPMDGGRVLRALLAMRMRYVRATQIAATIGQGLALVFGLAGLFGAPMLIFIALFVWIGAGQEASMTQMRSAIDGVPTRRAMITDFQTLAPQDPLSRAVDLILRGSQQDFPVVDDARVVGVLTRAALFSALAKSDPTTPVAEIMDREFQPVEADELLERAFQQLQHCKCRTLPVTEDGRLVGIFTQENLGEFMLIQTALGEHRAVASNDVTPPPYI